MKRSRILGVVLISVAVLLLLDGLQLIPNLSIRTTIWTIVFGYFMLRGLSTGSWLVFGVSTALLLNMYNKIYHFLPLPMWSIITILVLFSYGISLLFPKRRWSRFPFFGWGPRIIGGRTNQFSDTTSAGATFGSTTKYVTDQAFESGDYSVTFGEMTTYFDNAEMRHDSAVINVSVTFGDLTLYVPKTWEVIDEVSAIFGDISIRHVSYPKSHTLYLRGNLQFGNVSVVFI